MLKFSTGLLNAIAAALKTAHLNGVLYLYSGPQPASANDAIQGTLLAKITLSGGTFVFGTTSNGLQYGTATGGIIDKPSADSWRGEAIAAGTAGWFRFMGNASDALGALVQTTETANPRLDGSVGISGADLNLPVITFEVGTPIVIPKFEITFPPYQDAA